MAVQKCINHQPHRAFEHFPPILGLVRMVNLYNRSSIIAQVAPLLGLFFALPSSIPVFHTATGCSIFSYREKTYILRRCGRCGVS